MTSFSSSKALDETNFLSAIEKLNSVSQLSLPDLSKHAM